jgi:hypothetical protein
MANKLNRSSHSDEKIAWYDALIKSAPGVERKGAAMPYTSYNGNMFSYIDKSGVFGLRLPPDELETFLKKYKTKQLVSFGMVMKEYAAVPDSLLKNTAEMKPWFKKSFAFVQTLKPKPSREK